ncbi:MAG: cation:proton antiporter [Rheinheimera sp.]
MSEFFPIQNPVLVFALVATLILIAPIVMARYRLPGMIGLLFAGAVLGPNALNVLERDTSFVLFGTVGLLYIMFTAALEIDMATLKRYRMHSLIFGLLTFAIPISIGTGVGWLFGFDWPAAILLGSMFASHTLLAYPIASRLGISKNQAVTTAVGGTIITDTLALLVLAVIASMTKGEITDGFWYQLGISLTLYMLLILFGLPPLARWFFKNVSTDGVAEFVFVLAMVFLCASAAPLVGAEPIVGAFLAGLALNRLIPHHGTLMNRIQFTGEALFIPFFLLSVGMLLDLSIFLGSFRAWLIALAMVVTILLTKWLAAEATRWLLGYSKDQAKVVYGLSLAQAAATLAATIVGHEIGLFDEAVVNGAILMILVTCFIAPWLVDRYGRKMALAAVDQDEPAADMKPQRILVAVSTAADAEPLLDLAKLIRDPAMKQPLWPITVVEDGSRSEKKIRQANQLLDQCRSQLAAAEVASIPVSRIDLNVAGGILRARRELDGSIVVIGWSEHTTTPEYLFGSMQEQLLHERDFMLVVSRARQPLQLCQRVYFAIPPHAEHEPGFVDCLQLVKNFCQRQSLQLTFLAIAPQLAIVQKKIGSLFDSHPPQYQPLEQWSDLLAGLQQVNAAQELIVMYGVRSGGIAWQSSLQQLPEVIASTMPDANILVIYPAEPIDEATSFELGTMTPASP